MAERWMSDWMLGDLGTSTRVRVLLLGTLCTGLMLGIIVLTFVLRNESSVKADELAHLQAATLEIDQLSQLAVDLETGQRGFLLTGQDSYLQPFERARRQLPDLMRRIETQLPDEHRVRANFDEIGSKLAAKQQDIEMSIDIARKEGVPRALEFFRTNFGQAVMDEIRVLERTLNRSLRENEARLRAEIEDLRFQRELSIASLALLGTIAAIAAFVVLMGYVRALETERSARQEAERSASESREKSNFLANMSHEIRTPMNAIFGFAQLLGDLVTGEREQYYVRAIAQSGKSLLALINDILDMSKIEAGKLDLHPEPTDLRDLINGVAMIFSQMAMDKGIKLQTRVAADLPARLALDPMRVRQLLFNLIGNAIKYTDLGGVKLHARSGPSARGEDRRTLILEVSDSGVGIPAADLAKIFEPFTQATADGQQPRAGTGLGLSIVKRLVELMGGEIQVESTLGRGAQFRVVIPDVGVAAAPSPSALARPSEVRLSDLPPLRIVVIDDVELNRSLIEGLFAGTHHRIYSANDGAAGVALVRREVPNFVLMDVRMPGMDGVEALRQIRADPALAKVRVIAVTASSLLSEDSMRTLFDGYVRKPIAREALYEVLGGVCEPGPESTRRAPDMPTFPELPADTRAALVELQPELRLAVAHAAATLSTDDVHGLLQCLSELPRDSALNAIRALGQAIEGAATVFDLGALETHLGELADIVDSWANSDEHAQELLPRLASK